MRVGGNWLRICSMARVKRPQSGSQRRWCREAAVWNDPGLCWTSSAVVVHLELRTFTLSSTTRCCLPCPYASRPLLLCLVFPSVRGQTALAGWRAGWLAWADAPVGFPRARVCACVCTLEWCVAPCQCPSLRLPVSGRSRGGFLFVALSSARCSQPVRSPTATSGDSVWLGERRLPTRNPRKSPTQGPKRARPMARRRLVHSAVTPIRQHATRTDCPASSLAPSSGLDRQSSNGRRHPGRQTRRAVAWQGASSHPLDHH